MIELHELKESNYDYVANLAAQDEGRPADEMLRLLRDNLLFGFVVHYEGRRQGVAFALKINDVYSLDGYNEHQSKHTAFGASKAGRAVVNRLLKYHTDDIYTSHNVNRRNVTALALRIGFNRIKQEGDLLILKYGGK